MLLRQTKYSPIIRTLALCLALIFSFESVAYDLSVEPRPIASQKPALNNLAIHFKNDDILGQVSEDKGKIQLAFATALRTLSGHKNFLTRGSAIKIKELAEAANDTVIREASNYEGLQLFMYEVKSNTIMVRFTDEKSPLPRTYNVVVPKNARDISGIKIYMGSFHSEQLSLVVERDGTHWLDADLFETITGTILVGSSRYLKDDEGFAPFDSLKDLDVAYIAETRKDSSAIDRLLEKIVKYGIRKGKRKTQRGKIWQQLIFSCGSKLIDLGYRQSKEHLCQTTKPWVDRFSEGLLSDEDSTIEDKIKKQYLQVEYFYGNDARYERNLRRFLECRNNPQELEKLYLSLRENEFKALKKEVDELSAEQRIRRIRSRILGDLATETKPPTDPASPSARQGELHGPEDDAEDEGPRLYSIPGMLEIIFRPTFYRSIWRRIKKSVSTPILSSLFGLSISGLSGASGIGGGVLMMPLLRSRLYKLDPDTASGTSLGLLCLLTTTACITHFIINPANFSPLIAFTIILYSCYGMAIAKTVFVEKTRSVQKTVFPILLLLVGLQSFVSAALPVGFFKIPEVFSYPFLAWLELGTGMLAFLMGISGGPFRIPILCMFFGLSMPQAAATSVLAIPFVTLYGAILRKTKGDFNVNVFKKIAPSVVVGTVLGVYLLNKLPNNVMKVIFGLFITTLGIWRILKRSKETSVEEELADNSIARQESEEYVWVDVRGVSFFKVLIHHLLCEGIEYRIMTTIPPFSTVVPSRVRVKIAEKARDRKTGTDTNLPVPRTRDENSRRSAARSRRDKHRSAPSRKNKAGFLSDRRIMPLIVIGGVIVGAAVTFLRKSPSTLAYAYLILGIPAVIYFAIVGWLMAKDFKRQTQWLQHHKAFSEKLWRNAERDREKLSTLIKNLQAKTKRAKLYKNEFIPLDTLTEVFKKVAPEYRDLDTVAYWVYGSIRRLSNSEGLIRVSILESSLAKLIANWDSQQLKELPTDPASPLARQGGLRGPKSGAAKTFHPGVSKAAVSPEGGADIASRTDVTRKPKKKPDVSPGDKKKFSIIRDVLELLVSIFVLKIIIETLGIGSPKFTTLCFICMATVISVALIHEFGHGIMASFVNAKRISFSLRLIPFNAFISPQLNLFSKTIMRDYVLIAGGGPFANLFAVTAFLLTGISLVFLSPDTVLAPEASGLSIFLLFEIASNFYFFRSHLKEWKKAHRDYHFFKNQYKKQPGEFDRAQMQYIKKLSEERRKAIFEIDLTLFFYFIKAILIFPFRLLNKAGKKYGEIKNSAHFRGNEPPVDLRGRQGTEPGEETGAQPVSEIVPTRAKRLIKRIRDNLSFRKVEFNFNDLIEKGQAVYREKETELLVSLNFERRESQKIKVFITVTDKATDEFVGYFDFIILPGSKKVVVICALEEISHPELTGREIDEWKEKHRDSLRLAQPHIPAMYVDKKYRHEGAKGIKYISDILFLSGIKIAQVMLKQNGEMEFAGTLFHAGYTLLRRYDAYNIDRTQLKWKIDLTKPVKIRIPGIKETDFLKQPSQICFAKKNTPTAHSRGDENDTSLPGLKGHIGAAGLGTLGDGIAGAVVFKNVTLSEEERKKAELAVMLARKYVALEDPCNSAYFCQVHTLILKRVLKLMDVKVTFCSNNGHHCVLWPDKKHRLDAYPRGGSLSRNAYNPRKYPDDTESEINDAIANGLVVGPGKNSLGEFYDKFKEAPRGSYGYKEIMECEMNEITIYGKHEKDIKKEIEDAGLAVAKREAKSERRKTSPDAEERKIKNMLPIAHEAGPAIETNMRKGRNVLIVDWSVFKDSKSELDRDKWPNKLGVGTGSRFFVECTETSKVDSIIRKIKSVLSDRKKFPETVKDPASCITVQLSRKLGGEEIKQLKKEKALEGVRFLTVDTKVDISKMKYNERRAFRFDLYAMLLAARTVTARDINENTPIYQILKFFLETHGIADSRVFIEALVDESNEKLSFIINQVLLYRPTKPWDKPEYHEVAATLISA